MRVAIVENTKVTHHGQVGVALHEAAARIGLYKPWADGRLPEPADYDALVVFGGEQNACADDSHPYLPELAHRMRAFSDADRAVLGICLGSQILARGFGAENRIGTAPEFGWCKVELTDAGAADPVLGQLPSQFASFQWHSDTFTLPAGAVHLARSGVAAHQAFRLGRATYGTQFHFEAHRAVVADWARCFPAAIEDMAPGWLADRAEAAATAGAAADHAGLALARAFVAQIRP
ncbi:type 1 glutamine amidotransferase [Gemmobacter lutimaris]|uniref:Type 1 glutamine amidotransferase n=1 Tax=Gemmobacter lutimaris TaxID=2306023 RepID=A0A398BRJ4_9RHOB|nr:type 1 glutamine amidotransferase [Gemmobacter lutimaris]RID93409.1 type 1 glutamine amidotransferase [Gemmobacter lutimaris]